MNTGDVENHGLRRAAPRRLWLVSLAVASALASRAGSAQAQVGSGGTTGVVSGGPLGTSDFFIGIQKVQGVNLSDADKARFLNHASCQCKRDVWIKAILINAASAAKAQAIPGTDLVTMMLGLSCDNSNFRGRCLQIGQIPLSEFRLTGMLAHTTVDALAQAYGATQAAITGTGGVTGADDGGVGGTGGSSPAEVTSATDPCAVGDAFSQPVYIFVESTPGSADGGSAMTNIVIDGTPPPAPSPVTVTTANEALIVNWTSVNSDNSVPDLQGYQIFCSRADQYQVFKDGTFSTSVDSCPFTDGILAADAGATTDAGSPTPPIFPTDMDPMALANANTHYICSDFLSTSTSSHRVEILQNDIPYGIAVASVDLHGNASLAFPSPIYTAPIPTLDFYHQYRYGSPQGQATGGCSTGGRPHGDMLSLLAVGAMIAGSLALRQRGPRS